MILPNKRHHKLLALFLALILFCGVAISANFSVSEVKASDVINSGTWGNNVTWELRDDTLFITGQGVMQDASITWEDHTYTIHVPWGGYSDIIRKIVIGEGITHIGKANFSTYYKKLETAVLPSSLTSIGNSAFRDNRNLKNVNFSKQLKSIGDFAFDNCSSLISPSLPNALTRIGNYAFFGCNKFAKVIIPSSVKTVGENAYSGCNNLTEVKFSNGVVKLSEGAFAECPKLKTIDLPASVSSIGAMAFVDCNKLAS